MSWFRKKIATALIWTILMQTIGCATIPKEKRAEIWPATAETFTHLETNAEFRLLEITAIDDKPYTIPATFGPGPHKVRVKVEWSNLFQDETDIDLETVAGKRYVVWAIELKAGQDPSSVTIREKSFAKEVMEELAAVPLTIGEMYAAPLALIMYPLILISRKSKKAKNLSRPFEGCCFIWIEDDYTKEVISGNRPGRDLR